MEMASLQGTEEKHGNVITGCKEKSCIKPGHGGHPTDTAHRDP